MGKVRSFLLACIIGSGGVLFGYDQGIIGSTLAQTDFRAKFNPSSAEEGGIVSSFSGGAFCGAAIAGYTSNRLGRKKTIMLGALIALVGCALQTGAVNIAMLVVGRLIAGLAIGILTMVVPLMNSEMASPARRGLMAGLLQQMLSFGYVMANWIGYGTSFINGSAQWRIGLGMQCVWAVLLFLGMFFVYESPRWLVYRNRNEEAKAILHKLHYNGENEAWVEAEYSDIVAQHNFDMQSKKATIVDLFRTRPMFKRTALAVGIQYMTQMTGINVINYYGPQMYDALGYTDNDKLLINGLYGIIGPIVCAFALFFLVDRFGRKPLLLIGTVVCMVAMIAEAVIQKNYPRESPNKAAHKAGVAMIAIFSIGFSFSYGPISWIYSSEIFPNRIRHIGVAVATCGSWSANVLFGQTGSLGINQLGWSYYIAFAAFNAFNFVVILMFLPESKGVSLEAMSEVFGDSERKHDHRVDAGPRVEDGKAEELFADDAGNYKQTA